MTGWSISYILEDTTLEQLMMVYNYGIKFEETKATILINKYAEALSGEKKSKQVDIDKPPPKLSQLQAIFGDKVKPIMKD